MTTDRPIIQTRGLTKVFGANRTAGHAVRGNEIEVQPGEIVTLYTRMATRTAAVC